jgi:hypothetical protein
VVVCFPYYLAVPSFCHWNIKYSIQTGKLHQKDILSYLVIYLKVHW